MSFFKNRTVLGIICIILSLFICFAVVPSFNNSASQKTQIIRVTSDIRAGEMITENMLQTVEVGAFNLPNNVVRDTDTVVGRFATADLTIGDYIINTKLSDTPAAVNAYLYNLDGSKHAISVTVRSLATGLSGMLMPGDVVSVIAPDYKKMGLTVIPPELQFVEVIAVTANSGNDARSSSDSRDDENDRELPATVTLLVRPEQANILVHLEADGKLHIALVYRGMSESAALFIEAQDIIIDGIYYPPEDEDSDVDESEINFHMEESDV
ncbi:MAG: Flp pilus assembly protein CpaB [Oscillospiraceae bacterium]|nr:Flp pilus assembly protein CpaB [Oscillospiraceae bacterium]